MKKHFMLGALFLCLLIGFKIWEDLSLLNMINLTFLLGIIALVITVTINIWKTGFLSLFIDGFRVLGQFVIPKTRSAIRADDRIKNDEQLNQWKANIAAWISYTFTNLAVISLTVSLISLIVYYQ
ncbi:DUF3899 domain-containing protein [Heyndrickxia sporothermodurans]|uniref:DUF3899 domain-containing protein n=1 Tax=Heyndrickxia sporothermodurans TaxID=46224 RepID=A0A150L2C1_9BACI|nr:DUF3899 domain-containing protein [Heyndrickxia sporothermodurans]KYD05802.1 hypothetical protein B4102_3124 [Heyndrickxia sporothermodurans]MBL5767768.1 DUF3899 domain-containing protein [Heyndrickxia sporothermodurans]MBL5771274.1 DUF3899 domain-containing protein [Heyndrickxia sporothermodurans]MBL5774359.1 DUF3899 domain-containing protein [Heyndrickxia sporothermodurans]MBL5778341.1 DUF3899 domain-containing protein [Heyndrickxia sporothermodurans]